METRKVGQYISRRRTLCDLPIRDGNGKMLVWLMEELDR